MQKSLTRLFMAVLMVVLVVGASIMSVSAADVSHDGNHSSWTAITSETTIESDKNYYLLEGGYTGKVNVPQGITGVTICLCGQTLTSSETGTLYLNKNTEVTVVNCNSAQYGTITTTNTGSARGIYAGSGAVVTIKEGVKVTSKGDSCAFCTGTVILDGGELDTSLLKSSNQGAVYTNGGEIQIKSGIITSSGKALVVRGDAGKCYVSDGTITGSITQYTAGTGLISISGGTFDRDVSDWLSDATVYECKDNGDGTWTVGEKSTEEEPDEPAFAPDTVPGCDQCDNGWEITQDNIAKYEGVLDSAKSAVYVLNASVETDALTIEGDVTLCLHGNTLSTSDTVGTEFITVGEGATLTICGGENGEGTISGEGTTNTSCIALAGGTLNLESGTISGFAAGDGVGAAVHMTGGTFNLSGGTITENTGTTRPAVYSHEGGGTINMTGGAITANTITGKGYAAGVAVRSGTLNISDDAEISANTASAADAYPGVQVCAGIASNDSVGTVVMTGGTITGAGEDYSVCVHHGDFTLSGGTITGNVGVRGSAVADENTFTMSGADGIVDGDVVNGIYADETNEYYENYLQSSCIAISAGTVTGEVTSNELSTASITGGSFGNDVSDLVADGYSCALNDETNLYDVTKNAMPSAVSCSKCGTVTGLGINADNIAELGELDGGTDGVTYVLTENLATDNALTISGKVILCLNGNTLTASSSVGATFITIGEGAELTICGGENGEGVISGEGTTATRCIYLEGGTLNLTSGTISGFTVDTAAVAAAIHMNGGTFNMTGGTITGNVGRRTATVYCDGDGVINLSGGSIEENTVNAYTSGGTVGAGVTVRQGTLNISGTATIQYNTVSDSARQKYGIQVCAGIAGAADGKVVMTGGVINGNPGETSTVGVNRGTFEMTSGTINGTVAIRGMSSAGASGFNSFTLISGTVNGDLINANDTSASNSYFAKCKMDIQGGIVTGTITNGHEDSTITISGGTFNNEIADATWLADGFICEQVGDVWVVVVGNVEMEETTVACPVCGKTGLGITQKAMANLTELAGGENGAIYVLTEDVTAPSSLIVTGNVTLCLNGKTLTETVTCADSFIDVKADATLTICGGENGAGKIQGVAENTVTRGFLVRSGGELVLNSGIISGFTMDGNGGGVYVLSGGTFTMNNGTLSNNVTTGNGGGVYVVGTFTMNNGTITANKANSTDKDGGGVNVASGGTFNMANGTISGNEANRNGAGVYVSASATSVTINGTINDNVDCRTGTITGGTFNGEVKNGATGIVSITDGTFNGALVSANGSFAISGGTFNKGKNPNLDQTDWLDSRYDFEEDEVDGVAVWVVVESEVQLGQIESTCPNCGTGWGVTNAAIEAFGLTGDANGVLYILVDENVEAIKNLTVTGNVTLCLNNKTLTAPAETTGSFITVSDGATLTICGGGENGTISGVAENTGLRGILVESGGELILNSGTISGFTMNVSGGGVRVSSGGTFTMANGTISNNKTTGTTTDGGGVYVAGGTFEMANGTISGNEAGRNGAGIYVSASVTSATITNGTIDDGIDFRKGTISGGTFNGEVKNGATGTVSISSGIFNGTLTTGTGSASFAIFGGTFNGALVSESGSFTISGGSFNKANNPDLINWLAEDKAYKMTESGDNYVVTEGFYEDVVTYVRYASALHLCLQIKGDNDYLVGQDNAYTVTVTKGGEACSYVVEEIEVASGAAAKYLIIKGIAAKDMDDEIVVTVDEDEVFRGSVYTVAGEMYVDEDFAEAKTALAEMVNYGIAAQEYFEEGTSMDVLDSTRDNDSDPQYDAWTTEGSFVTPGHEDDVAVSLYLKDNIQLNVYVNAAFEQGAVTVTSGGAATVASVGNGITRITFDGIDVKDVKSDVNFTITLAGDEIITVNYSIENYVAAMMDSEGEQQALIHALMKYVDAVCEQ